MIFIYDQKNSFIHFRYCNSNEMTVNRGVYLNSNNPFFVHDGFYYISIHLELKNRQINPDFRFYINKKMVNIFISYFFKCIYAVFISYLKLKLIIENSKYNKKIILFFKIGAIFFLFYKSIICGIFKNEILHENKVSISVNEWRHLVLQMPDVSILEKFKDSYFENKIPTINGILDFKVLPLKREETKASFNDRYLAVSYRKIMLIDNKNNIYYLNPIYNCLNQNKLKYYVYFIESNVDIIRFNNEENESELKKYIVAPPSNILNGSKNKNICDYMPLI